MGEERPRIGVLAIQGDFAAHAQALEEAGADAVEVRKPAELAELDGLILPGGESTTFLKFLERDGFLESLQRFVAREAGLRHLCRLHSAGPQCLPSGTAEPGSHGHQRGTQCLRQADRQRHSNR